MLLTGRREGDVVAQAGKRACERHEWRDVAFGRCAREQNPHRTIIVARLRDR